MRIQKLSFNGCLLIGKTKCNTSDIKTLQVKEYNHSWDTEVITKGGQKISVPRYSRAAAEDTYEELLRAYIAASSNSDVNIQVFV